MITKIITSWNDIFMAFLNNEIIAGIPYWRFYCNNHSTSYNTWWTYNCSKIAMVITNPMRSMKILGLMNAQHSSELSTLSFKWRQCLQQCNVTLNISMTSNVTQFGTRIGTESAQNRHRIGPLPCSIYKFDMTSMYIFSIIDLGKCAPQANKLSLLRENTPVSYFAGADRGFI